MIECIIIMALLHWQNSFVLKALEWCVAGVGGQIDSNAPHLYKDFIRLYNLKKKTFFCRKLACNAQERCITNAALLLQHGPSRAVQLLSECGYPRYVILTFVFAGYVARHGADSEEGR